MVDDTGASPEQQAQLREMHRNTLAALEQLDFSSRAVVVLRDIEQLDYAEIAEILEIPLGTVKKPPVPGPHDLAGPAERPGGSG